MLVTITHTGANATDLGYLLHKHPAKLKTIETAVGKAHVFYPESASDRCTAAVLVEVDAIDLARNRHFRGGKGPEALDDYVNDRPYASSSMTAVALGKLFRTAMTGRCDARPELAATPIDLVIRMEAVSVTGGPSLARSLFEPLGWQVVLEAIPLDESLPEWGDSTYLNVQLTGTLRLQDALRQIYVLLPVMDGSKHYWVGDDEVEKLMRAGEGWLAGHPERETIMTRYLAYQRGMVDDAARQLEGKGTAEPVDARSDEGTSSTPGTAHTQSMPLHKLRSDAVLAALSEEKAVTVADLGCGEGTLLQRLAADRRFTVIIGADVSAQALSRAERRLNMDEYSDRERERVSLIQSSLTYVDDRIAGMDAVVLMEVIEHVEPERLPALQLNVFGHAGPGAVIVTTPNAEYNALYPQLPTGTMRHQDHRFEWSRDQFQAWANRVCREYDYNVEFRAVGEVDLMLGPPTQLALFRRV